MCEKTMERQKRIQEYTDSKFGIFIHWGPCAGLDMNNWEWKSHQTDRMKPYLDYFNEATKNFSMESWVKSFKDAGAKYITFIPRHVFNMYYNLYNSQVSPFHSERDFLGEISDACRKHGINLIIYQPLDVPSQHLWIENGFKDYEATKKRYINEMTDLLKEVVSRYKPFGIWLDGWPGHKKRFMNAGYDPFDFYKFDELTAAAREIDPDLLIGNKEMFAPYIDYISSEQFLTDHFGNVLTGGEIPMEINETLPASVIFFSNFREQTDFLTDEELQEQKRIFLKRFASAVGRGLNYLMNIGPLPNGEINNVDFEILKYIGVWTGKYSDAIYGTQLGPLEEAPWGYNVVKGNKIFLFIMDNREIVKALTCHRNYSGKGMHECGDEKLYKDDSHNRRLNWEKTGMPEDKKITAYRLPWQVENVTLLNCASETAFVQQEDQITIDCSKIKCDDDIIVLELCRSM